MLGLYIKVLLRVSLEGIVSEEDNLEFCTNPSYTKCRNWIERKIKDIRKTIESFSVIQKRLVLGWEENANMLSAICGKWNSYPYSNRSLLSPSSFINPYSVIHDISIDLDKESITEVLKMIMSEVTKQVFERITTNSGLEKGPEGRQVNVGEIVAWNKTEDNISKGLLFGRIVKAVGSDFWVELANGNITQKLPKQRVICLPQSSPFQCVEREGELSGNSP